MIKGQPLTLPNDFIKEVRYNGGFYAAQYKMSIDTWTFPIPKNRVRVPDYIEWKAKGFIWGERGSYLIVDARIDPTIKI